MKCILCLKIPSEPIDIFEEKSLILGMENIISEHFWMQPNHEDANAKFICTSCWISVDSFHKFYEEIKEAHCSFQEIKPVVLEDDFQEETTSIGNNFYDNNVLMDEDIKVEDNESINASIELQGHRNPLETTFKSDDDEIDIKSDSESEMPLSVLSKQIQTKQKISINTIRIKRKEKKDTNSKNKKSPTGTKSTGKKGNNSKDISEDAKASLKIKEQCGEKLQIHDGKWLVTSYADETCQKPISTEELDKFLKLNIELSCGICQKEMDNFACLHPHFAKFHDKLKPFVSCCGRKLKYRAHIVDHILVHKIPDYFKCVECSKVWPSRRNLKEHLAVHKKNFIYQCETCQKSFCSKSAVERHQEVHFVERPFKCDECDRFYASEYRLKQHAYNMHQYKKICEQCGQVFREKATFVRHQLQHTNQPKPYFECDICGARLSSKKILQKHHKFQHLEDSKEQNCSVCGITVKNLQALKRHMVFVHRNQREHKCTMCDKAFKRALTLKEHMTTHTGEVLYTCPHCPKTFNSNANMHSHRKKMHRKEWEENRRHPHMGATTNATETEENNQ